MTQPTDGTSRLQALVNAWMGESERVLSRGDGPLSRREAKADAFEQCADELAQALAAEPEVEADDSGRRWLCPHDGDFCFKVHGVATEADMVALRDTGFPV